MESRLNKNKEVVYVSDCSVAFHRNHLEWSLWQSPNETHKSWIFYHVSLNIQELVCLHMKMTSLVLLCILCSHLHVSFLTSCWRNVWFLPCSEPYIVAVKSVTLMSMPPSSEYCRSEILCAGFQIYGDSNSSCTVSSSADLRCVSFPVVLHVPVISFELTL